MKHITLTSIFAVLAGVSALPYTRPDGELTPTVADILSRPPFAMPPSSQPEEPIVTVAEIWGNQDVQTEQAESWLDDSKYWGVTDVDADAPVAIVHASAANTTQTNTTLPDNSTVPSDAPPANATGPVTHTILVNPNPGGYTFIFTPNRLNISVGDSVQWIWVDQQNIHSVVELTGDPETDTALCFLGHKAGGMDSGQRIAPYRLTKTYDASYAGQTVF